MQLYVLTPEGKPPHPMQPSNGAIPSIQVNYSKNGLVLLSIFCRCGSNTGKWFTREVPNSDALDFLNSQYYTWHSFGPEKLLEELAAFFNWEWTGGTQLVTEPLAKSQNKSLTLEDLGL